MWYNDQESRNGSDTTLRGSSCQGKPPPNGRNSLPHISPSASAYPISAPPSKHLPPLHPPPRSSSAQRSFSLNPPTPGSVKNTKSYLWINKYLTNNNNHSKRTQGTRAGYVPHSGHRQPCFLLNAVQEWHWLTSYLIGQNTMTQFMFRILVQSFLSFLYEGSMNENILFYFKVIWRRIYGIEPLR